MRWKDRPIVAFDTETTGFEPFLNGDRVVEVGISLLRVNDDGQVISQEDHQWLVNPAMPIPASSSRVHHIYDKDVVDSPRFEEIAEDVHALLKDAITVAHNAVFDRNMLSAEFKRAGMDWPEPLAEFDTFPMSLKQYPKAEYHNLGELCKRLNISLAEAHRAAADAAACGRCFTEMVRIAGVSDDLDALLTFGHGLGPFPEGGPFARLESGAVVFTEGPHTGEPVAHHPIHLAWMAKARENSAQGWRWRYSDESRAWAERWLTVRAAGKRRTSGKSFHAQDWVIDSCIVPDRRGP